MCCGLRFSNSIILLFCTLLVIYEFNFCYLSVASTDSSWCISFHNGMYNIFSHLSPILLFLYLFFRRWLFQLLSKEIDLSKKHTCLLTSVTIIKNTYCSLHYRILGTAHHISNNDSSSAIQLFIHDLVIKIRPTGMLILKWGPYQLPNTPLHTSMSFKHWYQGSILI